MTITVNGKPETVTDGCLLLAYLASRQVDPAHVVVEINRDIVDRARFAATTLAAGDTVEILRFVGGG